MKEYVGEYLHEGSKYGLNIFANNPDEVNAIIQSVRGTFVVLGELDCRIPFRDE